jgi:hypothetical protein
VAAAVVVAVTALLVGSVSTCATAAASPWSSVEDLLQLIRSQTGHLSGGTVEDIVAQSRTTLRPVADTSQDDLTFDRVVTGACRVNKYYQKGELTKANSYLQQNYTGPERDWVLQEADRLASLQDYDDSAGAIAVNAICNANF